MRTLLAAIGLAFVLLVITCQKAESQSPEEKSGKTFRRMGKVVDKGIANAYLLGKRYNVVSKARQRVFNFVPNRFGPAKSGDFMNPENNKVAPQSGQRTEGPVDYHGTGMPANNNSGGGAVPYWNSNMGQTFGGSAPFSYQGGPQNAGSYRA